MCAQADTHTWTSIKSLPLSSTEPRLSCLILETSVVMLMFKLSNSFPIYTPGHHSIWSALSSAPLLSCPQGLNRFLLCKLPLYGWCGEEWGPMKDNLRGLKEPDFWRRATGVRVDRVQACVKTTFERPQCLVRISLFHPFCHIYLRRWQLIYIYSYAVHSCAATYMLTCILTFTYTYVWVSTPPPQQV